jgi:colanic acid biosynthesis glycosyl transferase WcaI
MNYSEISRASSTAVMNQARTTIGSQAEKLPQRRLTIVTQWFPPEQSPFGRMMLELGTGLAQYGWDVTIVTGFPNHPQGSVFGGYRKRWLSEEFVGPVRVWRLWLATFSSRRLLARLATFLSFTLTASWRLLIARRPDVILAVLQPLSVGITLPVIARLKGSRLVLNIQDLHPDAQIQLGMIRNRWLIRMLHGIESYAYRNCAGLTVICDRFRQHVISRGASSDRVFLLENWVDTDRIRPQVAVEFRRENGFRDTDFIALWAGTLGYISGAAAVIRAAELLRQHQAIRFLIVGEGPVKESLTAQASKLKLTNVTFMPFQAEDSLAAMQSCADVSLVTMTGNITEVSVPSKVLAYFAAGRAVVASVPENSDTARMIRHAAAGIIVPPDDGEALAAAVEEACRSQAATRHMGELARDFAVQNLSVQLAVRRYDAALRSICGTT